MVEYNQEVEYNLKRIGISIPDKLKKKKRIYRLIEKFEKSGSNVDEEVFINEMSEAIGIETRLASRRKNVLMFTPLILAVLLSIISFFVYQYYLKPVYIGDAIREKSSLYSYIFNPLILAGLFFSGGIILWRYLQGDFIAEKSQSPVIETQYAVRGPAHSDRFETLEDKVDSFEKKIAEISSKDTTITNEKRQEFVETIKNSLISEASEDLLKDLEAKAKKEVIKETYLSHLDQQFGQSFGRLNKEIGALGRRGNLNLLLGIITTIIGLAVLGFFVSKIPSEVKAHVQPLSQSSIDAVNENLPPQAKKEVLKIFEKKSMTTDDTYKFIIGSFMPRLSLVILIELFAYFFLKLYKSSLSEIKYFQNELSNFEAKFVSLRIAIMDKDRGVFDEVIKTLSRTERNYILEKGQTTVELEREKFDQDHFLDAVNSLPEKIKKVLSK